MEFFEFIRELKVNEYDQLKPGKKERKEKWRARFLV